MRLVEKPQKMTGGKLMEFKNVIDRFCTALKNVSDQDSFSFDRWNGDGHVEKQTHSGAKKTLTMAVFQET